ncbi:hypothetical protein GCM10018785_69330 [Streptomyces longispororuber]|uniref:Uncharacterized protein n=1 Tax=Streptomyces longispororuber TaxID=68230 RepID=A0A919A8X1_9ACTN|nr:hypothetical protein [Streptomyces longispororuber]GHE93664.1 hypothetical protein GCM10018785_69330 [Streptomyces longispororuber]
MQNSTQRRKLSTAVAGLVAAAIVGTGLSGSAVAVDRVHEVAAPASLSTVMAQASTGSVSSGVDPRLAGVSDEEGEAAVKRAFDLIASIPEPLIQRVEAGDQDALREVSAFLNQQQHAQGAVVAFGWFGCAAGVAKFAAENGIGIAKAWKLVKKGKKVWKAVWSYIKHRTYPKGLDDDIVNLIVNSTGLPDLAHACM